MHFFQYLLLPIQVYSTEEVHVYTTSGKRDRKAPQNTYGPDLDQPTEIDHYSLLSLTLIKYLEMIDVK